MPARESCKEPFMGYPAVGAVHPVIPNKQLRNRLTDIAEVADDVFDFTFHEEVPSLPESDSQLEIDGTPADGWNFTLQHTDEIDLDNEGAEIDESDEKIPRSLWQYNPGRFYRLFDAQTLGLSVFESNVSAALANKARAVWQKSDLGQLRKELEQQTQRHAVNSSLQVMSNGVMPVGGPMPVEPRMTSRQKLAFNVQPLSQDDTIELVFAEHEIVKTGTLRRILRKPRAGQSPPLEPVIDFVPHITFLAYRPAADSGDIAKANEKINEIMHDSPITINLGQLSTERSRLVRKPHRH